MSLTYVSQDSVGPIVVTGAYGNLGRRVVDLLAARGRAVVALDLDTQANRAAADDVESRFPAVRSAWVDLTDGDAVSGLLAAVEPVAIVHLAAIIPPVAYQRPELARRVNVDGTAHLVAAAQRITPAPLFVEASSVSVHGARNPHRVSGAVGADTPLAPIDCYGAQKAESEALVAASGLPHATLRIGAIVMPDIVTVANADSLFMEQIIPGDSRVHAVDVRDAALAFANAAEAGASIDGKILMIGGAPSCRMTHRQLSDDLMEAVGIGRPGERASRPGDPDDDRSWFLTDWMDTGESQALLRFQTHTWDETLAAIRDGLGRRRMLLRLVAPVARMALRLLASVLHRRHANPAGRYADPWGMVEARFGAAALAPETAHSGQPVRPVAA